MGICCSACRKRRPRGDEREPLLPKYAPEIPPQSQFDKAADILAALSTGKYPSQDQINRAIRLLLSSDVFNTGNVAHSGALSKQGARVLDDVRHVLQLLAVIGTEKNGDDRVQDLLWQVGLIEEVPVKLSVNLDTNVSLGLEEGSSKLPPEAISSEEVGQDVHKLVASIRPLISLLITSNAFRLIISDILVTARDILADVALDVAKVAAIVEVRAEQVEEAVRPSDTEMASEKDRENGVGVPTLENLANVGESIQENAARTAKLAFEESEAKRKKVWERLEDESPDRVKEMVLKRITEIVEQAQASPQYTAALATLVTLSQKYFDKLASTVEAVGDTVNATAANADVSATIDPQLDADPHLTQALKDAKIIIERFLGHGLDLLGSKFTRLFQDLASDEGKGKNEFPAFTAAVTRWIQRALQQPGWIQTEAAQEQGSKLYDRLLELLHRDPKLKADARGIIEELYTLRDALASDTATNAFISAIQTLLSDLGAMGWVGAQVATRESAKQWEMAKAELWHDILRWVLPRVLRALRTIPLPRVELKSETLDMVVDKVTLASPSFVPDLIQVTNKTDFLLRASDATDDAYFDTSTSTRTRIVVRGLRLSIENIAYYLNAKGPCWLGWLDNGLLTIDIGGKRVEGDGVSLVLEIEVPSQKDRERDHDLFRVLDAKVDVPGLAFSMNQTRHWLFNTLVTQPLLGPLVRTGISFVLSAQIKSGLEALNARLSTLRDKSQAMHKGDSSALSIADYWAAVTHSEEATPPSPETLGGSASHSQEHEIHKHVETEATTKGIIRTTVTENPDGETHETLLAIGISEQVLPGLGGPNVEPSSTLVDEGRSALNDLDRVRQDATNRVGQVRDEAVEASEVVRSRLVAAGERMQQGRSLFAKKSDWKSSAFDL